MVLELVYVALISAPALTSLMIAVFMAVPGEQPEKFLREEIQPKLPLLAPIIGVIGRFSRK